MWGVWGGDEKWGLGWWVRGVEGFGVLIRQI